LARLRLAVFVLLVLAVVGFCWADVARAAGTACGSSSAASLGLPADAEGVSTWPELKDDVEGASSGGTFYLEASVEAGAGESLVLPAKAVVTFDLAGCDLRITEPAAGQAAIDVPEEATLTVMGASGATPAEQGVLSVHGGSGSDFGYGGGAGIGGDGAYGGSGGASGAVTVDGGALEASGGAGGEWAGGGAGVGGGGGGYSDGRGGASGAVTVDGGALEASGGAGGELGGGGAGVGGGGGGAYEGSGGASGAVTVGSGSLVASGGAGGAGAGAGAGVGGGGSSAEGACGASGAVTVGSGSLVASGGAGGEYAAGGAGVGGGGGGEDGSGDASSGAVTVEGGLLEASGGAGGQPGGGGGAGIGGGGEGYYNRAGGASSGAVTVEGGSLKAGGGAGGELGGGGAGVGGGGGGYVEGSGGASGAVTVEGGSLEAAGGVGGESGGGGAGVGGGGGGAYEGSGGASGVVTVGGGSLEVLGGAGGESGGGGAGAGGGSGAGVGGGGGGGSEGSSSGAAGSLVVPESSGSGVAPTLRGEVSASLEVESGGRVTVPEGGVLALDGSGANVNEGAIALAGTLEGSGSLENEGSIVATGPSWSVAGYGPGSHAAGPSITVNAFDLGFSVPQGAVAPSELGVFAATVEGSGQTLPAGPALSGYTFEGWYTAEQGGDRVEDSTALEMVLGGPGPVTATLHAHYAASPAKASPGLSSAASSGVALGGKVHDEASLSGGDAPSGSITFELYGPSDATCASSPVYTSPGVTVTGDGTYESGEYAPSEPGTYRWVASYSGDANNEGVEGSCGEAGETVSVGKDTQSIDFPAPSGHVLGEGDFSVSASVSSGLPVSFASATRGVCTVTGASVHLVAAGTCTIIASQPGNGDHEAAPEVQRSFTVTAPAQPASTPALTPAPAPATVVKPAPPSCPSVDVRSSNFKPRRPKTLKGDLHLPGLRARLSVDHAVRMRVVLRLAYREGGKTHSVSLGKRTLSDKRTAALRLALPARLRKLLPAGTEVSLSMRIHAAAKGVAGCRSAYSETLALHTHIVTLYRPRH
jgi:hypothetical protein